MVSRGFCLLWSITGRCRILKVLHFFVGIFVYIPLCVRTFIAARLKLWCGLFAQILSCDCALSSASFPPYVILWGISTQPLTILNKHSVFIDVSQPMYGTSSSTNHQTTVWAKYKIKTSTGMTSMCCWQVSAMLLHCMFKMAIDYQRLANVVTFK